MWFKQILLFQLTNQIDYAPEKLNELLQPLAFTPCLPSLPSCAGWVSPIPDDDNAPLVHAANGKIMLCLQIEEKILPATVIRQAVEDKIKKIEARDDRKVRQKEKLTLKDEVTMTLLPRAFTRLTRIYAYIDTVNNLLVVGTTQTAKVEQFLAIFKRSVTESVKAYEINKPSPIMTHWLKNKSNPVEFAIAKSCVLQDPQQQNRMVRCQQQDLFAPGIQTILKDGCEVKQLGLCWHDRINFTLADDFSLRGIQYEEEVIAAANDIDSETKQQQFDADFFIMSETLSGLLADLMKIFVKNMTEATAQATVAA
ncbi:MAG: recombination-associated protein RdgC [Pseudomonadota bacterium]